MFKGVTSNRLFMGIIAVTLILQVGGCAAVCCRRMFGFYRFAVPFPNFSETYQSLVVNLTSCLSSSTDRHHRVSWEVHINCSTELETLANFNRRWHVQVGSSLSLVFFINCVGNYIGVMACCTD